MKRSARIFVAGLLCTVIATGCASTPSKDSEDTQPKEKMGVLGFAGLFVKALGYGLVEASKQSIRQVVSGTGPSIPSKGSRRGSVVCDRTPAQGMAPPPPGMCNDPTSGGMVSRESMERNQAQADRVRMKYEQDARQRQQEQKYHQRSLAAQEDERKQREQANTAYWARQEQESRALRVREDAEREKRLAAQEEVRRQNDQERIAFWAKREQESNATREREEAERVKRIAAQEEVREEREKIWAELWTKKEKESHEKQASTNTQASAQDVSVSRTSPITQRATVAKKEAESAGAAQFVYDCDHFPGQGSIGRRYTESERAFVVNCGAQASRRTTEINASNQRLDTQIKVAEGVKTAADIAGTGLAVGTGVAEGAAVIRGTYAVGKIVVAKQAAKSAGATAAREVDAVGTGGITKTGSSKAKSHGNKLDDKPAEGYTLRNRDTEEIQKYGETTMGEGRYGEQKRYSKKYLKENNVDYQKEISGTKKEMHQWQHEKIIEYKKANGGARPALNKNDY